MSNRTGKNTSGRNAPRYVPPHRKGQDTDADSVKSNESKASATGKVSSPLAKLIASEAGYGRIICTISSHYEMSQRTEGNFAQLRTRSHGWYLNQMGAAAKCEHERSACESKWRHPQDIGTFETEWIPAGKYVKGLGKPVEGLPARRVLPVHYQTDSAMRLAFNKAHPGWVVVSVGDKQHDHPFAHACAQLSSHLNQRNLPRGTAAEPKRYVDLFGNPKANAALNKNSKEVQLDTVVALKTPADAIRVIKKWGSEADNLYHKSTAVNVLADPALAGLFDRASGFVSYHSGYYLDPVDVAAFVSKHKGKLLEMTVLRFPKEPKGTVNNGEQTYTRYFRDNVCYVKQDNSTGVSYEHPVTDFWFENTSAKYSVGSMSWDVENCGGDTYKVSVTHCPPELITRQLVSAPRPFKYINGCKAPTDAEVLRTGKCTIPWFNRKLELEICDHEAFVKLRGLMSCESREPEKWRDHVSRVKRHFVGVQRETQAPMPSGPDMRQLAMATFWVDYYDDGVASGALEEQFYDVAKRASILKGNGPAVGVQNVANKVLQLCAAGYSVRNMVGSRDKQLEKLVRYAATIAASSVYGKWQL